MEAEVVVVGAGPAGSMTAIALAEKGHDVMMIDRSTFPRDKTCGDAVPESAIETLNRHGLRGKIRAEIEQGHFQPVERMLLVGPSGQKIDTPFVQHDGAHAQIAPRIFFDAMLQQHAVDVGVRFVQGQVLRPVTDDEGRVVGVEARRNGHAETVKSQIVVGADGVTSAVARALVPEEDVHEDHHRAVALRAYIEDLDQDPRRIEFYLYRQILPGYAWIFPTGEQSANIGLGMRLDHFRQDERNLKKMLDDFLEFPDIKPRLLRGGELRDIKTWQLNFGSKTIQRTFDGAVLVGDAAGLINPLTGGGISNAIVSAELAAAAIHTALRVNDTSRAALRVYEVRCEDALHDSMRNSHLLQRTLLRFPTVIDGLIWAFGARSSLAQTFLSKL